MKDKLGLPALAASWEDSLKRTARTLREASRRSATISETHRAVA